MSASQSSPVHMDNSSPSKPYTLSVPSADTFYNASRHSIKLEEDEQSAAHPLEDDDNKTNNHTATHIHLLIHSLKEEKRSLQYSLQRLQSDYNDMENKYQLAVEHNKILRESEAKYNQKCLKYDELSEHYDSLKADLFKTKQRCKSYKEQNTELQMQKEELLNKNELIEQHNIEYKRELNELRQMHQTLNDELISLHAAFTDSQTELHSVKQIKTEENLNQLNSFTEQIRRLNQKITDLYRENEELRANTNCKPYHSHKPPSTPMSDNDAQSAISALSPGVGVDDRDSYDEDEDEQHRKPQLHIHRPMSPPHIQRITSQQHTPPQYVQQQQFPKGRSRSRSLSKSSTNSSPNGASSSNANLPIWTTTESATDLQSSTNVFLATRAKSQMMSSEDMEYLLSQHKLANDEEEEEEMVEEEVQRNGIHDGVTLEMSESLWHDIDIQVIKIECLISNDQHKNGMVALQSLWREIEEENAKLVDYHIEDNVDKLPRRLEGIYESVERLQTKLEKLEKAMTENEELEDVRQRYESMLALSNIKITNLQHKISELKAQKDTLNYQLMNLKGFYEGYKQQARNYLNQYKSTIESTNRRMSATMNEMTRLRYWIRKAEQYGITSIVVLFVVYLLYREKQRRKLKVRHAVRLFIGY